jgi:hypothetical protein
LELALAEKGEFAIVCRVQGNAVAQIIKGHLESEGIPVLLQYESAGLIYGITTDGIGEVRVLVPAAFLEEARKIVEPQNTPDVEGDKSL